MKKRWLDGDKKKTKRKNDDSMSIKNIRKFWMISKNYLKKKEIKEGSKNTNHYSGKTEIFF